ncbi:MAG: L,D-transpeptidase family protein [Pseudomonadota bacterium]|nr:L,D-transpeptidase family protein [Pseudomonadota bacterium]
MNQLKSILITVLLLTSCSHAATYRYHSNSDIIGKIQYHRISGGDSWESIAYYYDVGYLELRRANPQITNIKKSKGKSLLIPTEHILPEKALRKGIVVNLSEKRLYYFVDDRTVVTYPIAVGRSGWKSPSFSGHVTRKKIGPTWRVPKSIAQYHYNKYGEHLPKAVGPGPDNPLGNYAIYTSKARILIHGTNNELLIGKEVSSGCIRMFNRNIAELHSLVSIKDPVHFITTDEKIGIRNGYIYYEKTKPYRYGDAVNVYSLINQMNQDGYQISIDKELVQEALKQNTGIPVAIGIVR